VDDREPSQPEGTGPSEAPEQTIERLKQELGQTRAERDRALEARDALIRQVLPLSRGPLEPDPARGRGARVATGIIAIVLVGAVGALLLQSLARAAGPAPGAGAAGCGQAEAAEAAEADRPAPRRCRRRPGPRSSAGRSCPSPS